MDKVEIKVIPTGKRTHKENFWPKRFKKKKHKIYSHGFSNLRKS